MLMVDETLFKSEWFVNMGVDERYMYLYLLTSSSNKTGIFEWNERLINFCANTTRKFTKSDILTIYGHRIQRVPGRDNTLIIVDYIRFNWCKDGRALDPVKNKLDRAIVKELASYGLTMEAVNEMAKHKVNIKKVEDDTDNTVPAADVLPPLRKVASRVIKEMFPQDVSVTDKDIQEMFAGFWEAYPGPRKQDKKKCLAKFAKYLREADDAVALFNKVMAGLDKWKATDTWTKDDGRFVCAPLVWLNNERWDAEVTIGNSKGRGRTANANCQSTETDGLF